MARVKKSDQLLSKLGQSLDKSAGKPAEAHRGAPAPAATPPPPPPAAPRHRAPPPPAAESTPPPHSPPPRPAPVAVDARHAAAIEIVNRHMPFALGAGLIPLPLVDVAAISGVQLKLIAELSKLFGVSFDEHRAKNLVVVLVGGVGAWTLAVGALGSIAKTVPGVGFWFAAGTLPLMSGAVTYAIGHVFIRHFETGGTLLNFDAPAMRQAFREKIEEGKAALRSLAPR